jgi:alkaline phosphatase D
MAKDTTNQLFGYHGTAAIAFGEFTFDTKRDIPSVTFRLIDQFGNIMEEYIIPHNNLTPQ